MNEIDLWREAVRRRAHLTIDARDFILKAVENAQMSEAHNHLDALLTTENRPESPHPPGTLAAASAKRDRRGGPATH